MADFPGTPEPDSFFGTPDPDTINGQAGNDVLFGAGGNDTIDGGADDDLIRGEGGDDVLIGGDGSDFFRGGAGVDSFDGGSENPLSTTFGSNSFGDRISFFEMTATQGVVADLRTGVISNDGFGNVETMTGIEGLGGDTAFVDTFHGNDLRNLLLGGKDDFLYGYGEEDFFQLGGASAVVDGGTGIDWLNLITAGSLLPDSNGDGVAEIGPAMTAGWIIDMPFNYIADGFGNSGTILNIENVTGTELNDIIFGDAQDNVISGGAGDDLLRGNEGNDTLSGGDGSDHMRGGDGVDSFDGGAEDPLSSTFGDNSFGDRISFYEATATQGVVADLRTGVISNDGFGNVETMTGIEGLGGDTAFVDTFHGNDLRNLLLGGKDDFLYGYGEEDFFQLGGAPAMVDGGTGTDWANLITSGYLLPDSTGDGVAENGPAMTAGWVVDLFAGTIVDGFGNNGTITNVENLVGTELDDRLTGNADANRLEGGDGGDLLNGGAGDDTLLGGNGDDFLMPGFGNDTLDGGDGLDRAFFYISAGSPPLYITYGTGAESSKILVMQSGATPLRVAEVTQSGDSYTVTGVGSFSFLGTNTLTNIERIAFSPAPPPGELTPATGFSVLVLGTGGNDNLEGNVGNDLINAGFSDDLANGLDGDDLIRGEGGADHLIGGAGNDILVGGYSASFFPQPGDFADHLEGGAGDDLLRGGDGDDWLEGGDDNDNLRGDAGSDTMDGGAGIDFVSFAFVSLGYGIGFDARNFGSTATFSVADPLGGTDTVSNVELLGITGTSFDDFIRGSLYFTGSGGFFANQLYGDGGNDTIFGGPSNDFINGGTGDDNLRGEAGDDTLVGGDGSDLIRSGAGVDTIDGGSEDPLSTTFGPNSFGDRLSFFEVTATQGVVADLRTGIISNDGFGNVETMTGIEGLGGDTAFVDTFHGNTGRNVLLGSKGDFLYGYEDEDFIQLSGAAAVTDGGTGTDWLTLTTSGYLTPDSTGDGVAENSPAMTSGWTVNLAGSTIVDGFGDSGFITGIENVAGTQFTDSLFGNGQANRLEGGAGGDNLRGNGGDDILIGGDGNDLMRGGTGIDSFDGGAHTLVRDGTQPGAYGDRVSFSEAGATQGASADLRTGIIANDGFGNVEAMTGIESLGADTAFADTLHGDDNSNFIWGGPGDFLYGHGDDDYMQMSGAAAVMDGGDGVDTLTISTFGYMIPDNNGDGFAENSPTMTAGWTINLAGGGVTDGFGNIGLITGIENVVGTELNDNLFGNAQANRLEGGAGGDNLRGNGGNDTLIGGDGDDLMRGGNGVDTFDGGSNTLVQGSQPGGLGDRVSFSEAGATQGASADLRTGIISNDGFGNVETMTGIESLGADTAFADTLHGDDNSNFIWGGPGDFLYGHGDDDQMQMNGAAAMMDGGDGVDTLTIWTFGYMIPDNTGDGFAEQSAPMTSGWTIRLDDGTAVDGFGNNGSVQNIENVNGTDLADVIHGNGTENRLDGGADDDTLIGGGGNDTLTGGAGNDDLDGGTGADVAYFLLDVGAVGTLSIVAGTGPDAGKQLIMLTDGATSTRIAEITTSGAIVTVSGVNAGSAFGSDTVTNVQQLIFAGADPTGPAALSVDVAAVTGIVSDGYLAGATIFIDENNNGLLDPGEVSTVTDASGTFIVPELGSGTLVAYGGTSTDTGLANELVLTAPNGATVVNPLTTLVQAIAEMDGVDPEVAEAQLLAALGLDLGLDLLNTDLIEAAAGGDTDALDAQKAAAIVVAILTAAEDAAGGAEGAEQAAVDALAGLIADGSVDLTDSAVIEQVLEAAAPDAGDLGPIAQQVADTAVAIDEAETLDEIADSQAAALLTGNDLDNILTGGDQDDVLSGFGGNDILTGGNGTDRQSGGSGGDLFVHQINADKVAGKTGPIALDLILDFQPGQDKIDLSGIDANLGLVGDQAFRLIGGGSSELAGDLWVRTFGTMNAAENALGIEIDGVTGDSPFAGKVSVLFGNVDGGAPDFALVLIGAPTITVSDLIL